MNMVYKRLLSGLLLTTMVTCSAVAAEQECSNNLTQTTPDSRFTDMKDGTVKDTQTGLLWQRCSIGQTWANGTCTGQPKLLTWQQALSESQKFGTGWRLPNIKELSSLIEYGCRDPQINMTIFPNISYDSAIYLSSTPSLKEVDFLFNGFIPIKINNQVMGIKFKSGGAVAANKTPESSTPSYALAVKSE